jgi:predicted small lipoprotein YifL
MKEWERMTKHWLRGIGVAMALGMMVTLSGCGGQGQAEIPTTSASPPPPENAMQEAGSSGGSMTDK